MLWRKRGWSVKRVRRSTAAEQQQRNTRRRRRRRESRLQDKHEILKLMARARSWNVPQIPAVIPDELPLNCCQLGPLLVRLCRIGTNGITHSNKGFETRHKKKICFVLCAVPFRRIVSKSKYKREKQKSSSTSPVSFSLMFENDGMATIPGCHCRVVSNYDDNTVGHAIAARKHSCWKDDKAKQQIERRRRKKEEFEVPSLFLLALTLIDPSFFIRPTCPKCYGSMDLDIPVSLIVNVFSSPFLLQSRLTLQHFPIHRLPELRKELKICSLRGVALPTLPVNLKLPDVPWGAPKPTRRRKMKPFYNIQSPCSAGPEALPRLSTYRILIFILSLSLPSLLLPYWTNERRW